MSSLKLCLASPYALAGAHPVAEHVRGVATALAERGHRVTVLAPSSSTRALRSGRRRLRALTLDDDEALIALDGEPLQVAVSPGVPLRQRGRRRGAGIPVAARANVALAVGQGGFDVVHAFEPVLPGIATSALRYSPGLTVATFHAPDRALHYPVRGGTLERYRARIDALIATSDAAVA
jgi:phosphatidyl-myo-inositol alpha-mannosyltransferase